MDLAFLCSRCNVQLKCTKLVFFSAQLVISGWVFELGMWRRIHLGYGILQLCAYVWFCRSIRAWEISEWCSGWDNSQIRKMHNYFCIFASAIVNVQKMEVGVCFKDRSLSTWIRSGIRHSGLLWRSATVFWVAWWLSGSGRCFQTLGKAVHFPVPTNYRSVLGQRPSFPMLKKTSKY